MTRRVPPEVIEAARALLDDGASYREAARTLGVGNWTLSKHLPGRGWTSSDGGRYGQLVRRGGGAR